MHILTHGLPLENSEGEKIYLVTSPSDENKYTDAGYQRHERIYKIISGHKDYTVICPEFRTGTTGSETVMISPDFLFPGRLYLAEVYLFAIDLYSNNPAKSQREAAEETRKRFDLQTFAHTTLGRVLKSLTGILEAMAAETDSPPAEQAEDKKGRHGSDADEPDSDVPDKSGQRKFPTVRDTLALRLRAARFLRGGCRDTVKKMTVADYREIARKWFEAHQRFLL
jgi:hypothetical protein